MPNAGRISGANMLKEENERLSILLEHGAPCGNGKNANYSTRFDFFCLDGEPEKVNDEYLQKYSFLLQSIFKLRPQRYF